MSSEKEELSSAAIDPARTSMRDDGESKGISAGDGRGEGSMGRGFWSELSESGIDGCLEIRASRCGEKAFIVVST
jgi:hypothetical protein